jgi:anti-sigma regulatory factor (Ser/Thr protein kinase)
LEEVLVLAENRIRLHYIIDGDDFSSAGEASSAVKKVLTQIGINPFIIKKVAIAMYEAEINAVIHASGGEADIVIDSDMITVMISDKGPGIPDVELAMQEGYSTAADFVREMGFGAGMGLPNIKRYADIFQIDTKVNEGTTLTITVRI